MFFGIIVEAGKKYESVVEETFHISAACIEPSKNPEPVSLYCKTESADEEFLICSLDGQQTRQVSLDLLFVEGSNVTFSLKGKGKVHLTGYLAPDEQDYDFGEESDFDESEDEEVSEEELSPAKVLSGQKRTQLAAKATVPNKKAKTQESPSQATNGKPTANGKSIPVKVESAGDEDDEDEEDSDDDDLSDDGELQRMLAGLKKAKNASPVSGGDMSVDDEDDEDDDEDDFDEDDEDDEEEVQGKKISQAKKEIKQNLQKPPQKGPQQQQQQQQQQRKPQHQQNQRSTPNNNAGNKFSKGKSPFGGNKTTPNQQGGGFKKDGNNSFNKNKGLVVEDLHQGHGPTVTKGRLVTVAYVGRLNNGKEFDRGANFSFRLGHGEVIKGWDLGLENARVGCKRKLKVPAHLAYGSKRVGPLPPNSDLTFEVEVKSIK